MKTISLKNVLLSALISFLLSTVIVLAQDTGMMQDPGAMTTAEDVEAAMEEEMHTTADTTMTPTSMEGYELETRLTVNNLTKSRDATSVQNEPGDVIHVTATVKNLGPADLLGYEAEIVAEKLFGLSSLVNPGDGGILSNFTSMTYPLITQAGDCNCTNKFEFTVQFDDDICLAEPDLVKGGATVTFEDKARKLTVDCSNAAVVEPVREEVTPEPVVEVMTSEEAKLEEVPETTKSGPEHMVILAIVAAIAYALYRKRKEELIEIED